MKKTPYIAIGNDELGKKAGKFSTCPNCLKKHKIMYVKSVLSNAKKEKSRLLGCVKCPENKALYLVAVGGKLIDR